MSSIRVTFSGLIAFLVSISSLVTGLFFVIIVTRQLTQEEFGAWTFLNTLVFYVLVVEPVISYWTSRQIARGQQVGKTAIFTGSIFSIGAFAVYSILALIISSSLGLSLTLLLLASALIPLSIINQILSAINLGSKPHFTSYGVITFEISKIPLGLGFVYFAQMGLAGALLSIIFANLIRTIMLFYLTRDMLKGIIDFKVIKFWLKNSWLIAYRNGEMIINKLDVMLISFALGSFGGLAFWGAAQAIGMFVNHAGQISQALYPKLLADGKKEFVTINFKRTLFFAIPITAASIVFAKPGLHILNPIYTDAVYVVYFIAISFLISVIRGFFFKVHLGFESIDANEKASFRDFVKSKLFLVPTLNYIFSISYILMLGIFLFFLKSDLLSEIDIVITWSIIYLVATIPVTIYIAILTWKQYRITLPFRDMVKFGILALIISLITYFIMENTLVYSESIFDFLPEIIPLITLGGIFYFGISYLVDESVRNLYKSIIQEFRKK